jgi:hypothetical protein
MFIKEKIMDNKINNIIQIYKPEKTRFISRFDGKKSVQISLSKHKGKSGRQYALFCRVYFGKHKK